ncbi:MAG TPA: nitrate ABC transporter, permease protein, partial [Polyangiaceae bacterium]|nr:nitrate ABC transporter, permease protein [Polyangiaceae bacterium]
MTALNKTWQRLVKYGLLPMVGIGAVIVLWAISSATWADSLPSPAKTWEVSKPYIVAPFEKRGELDQGILRFTWYSLLRVAKGYVIALAFGVPIGLFLGLSRFFANSFDPII